MHTLGSVASVIAAIREDAAAEVERIEESAAAECTQRRADAAAATIAIADRAERLADARRRAATVLAEAEWSGRRAVIEQREAWIRDVVANAIGRAAADPDSLAALAREALANLPALPCEIHVAAGDEQLAGEAWCAVLAEATGKPAVTRGDASPIAGGCIATCGDVTFDNSFEARARRAEPQWRASLSKLYAVQG